MTTVKISKSAYPYDQIDGGLNISFNVEYKVIGESKDHYTIKDDDGWDYILPKHWTEVIGDECQESFELPQEKSYISIDAILTSLKDTPIALVIDQLNGSPSFRIECEIDQDVSLFEFDNISDAMKSIDCLKFLLEHKQ